MNTEMPSGYVVHIYVGIGTPRIARAWFESIQRPNATELKSEPLSMSTCVSLFLLLFTVFPLWSHTNTHRQIQQTQTYARTYARMQTRTKIHSDATVVECAWRIPALQYFAVRVCKCIRISERCVVVSMGHVWIDRHVFVWMHACMNVCMFVAESYTVIVLCCL